MRDLLSLVFFKDNFLFRCYISGNKYRFCMFYFGFVVFEWYVCGDV